jgi:hypothetical protein
LPDDKVGKPAKGESGDQGVRSREKRKSSDAGQSLVDKKRLKTSETPSKAGEPSDRGSSSAKKTPSRDFSASQDESPPKKSRPDRFLLLQNAGDQCYDHNFLRFLTIFREKIGVFLKNQCYHQFFQ